MKSLSGHSSRLKPGANVLLSLLAALTFSFVMITDTANVTTDVFLDAVVAGSGTVTYEANTDVTGVLSFDKSQQHWVNMNALQDDLDGKSRSVFMWVKAENNVSSNQALFAVNASNGDNLSFLWIDDSGDNLEVNRGGTTNESASFDMGGGVWHYVGWSYDHATGETVVYVNGIENDRFTTGTSVPGLSAQYSLGQEFDGGNNSDFYNGDMAEISVWDEVLTGVDIQLAMKARINNGHPKYGNLVGYYSVFGNTGDDTAILTDHSGKGNHGIMQNGFAVDFTNVQSVEGFNAIDWYENLSWKKDGTEVSTASEFTTTVAAGNYEFIATRDFIESTDTWAMTAHSNAAVVDDIPTETLCEDDPVIRSVPNNLVTYLDFEEGDDNYIEINSLADDLQDQDRSIFMWLNKESTIGSGDFNEVLVFQNTDVDQMSRFYLRSTEKLALWDGVNDRLNSSTELNSGTWYFVGYTYDHASGEAKLYVNGVAEDSGILDMPLGEGWFTSLGMKYNDNGPEDHLDGQLAEISIWNKVLSESEINDLMNAAPDPAATDLVAGYGTLTSLADNQLRDQSGNGHDGLASHNTIIANNAEAAIPGYNASRYATFQWTKDNVAFSTESSVTLDVTEGTFDYAVAYGTPFFPKTEEFSLIYTELLPSQPQDAIGVIDESAVFEVDEIPGATYQWYKKEENERTIESEQNGFPVSPSVLTHIRTDNGKLYIATRDGLAISEDKGENWIVLEAQSSGFPNDILGALEVDGDNIYIGTQNSGISISNNGGQSWSTTTSEENGFPFSNNPNDIVKSEGKLYVATESGIGISSNEGRSWSRVTAGRNGFSKSGDVNGLFVDGDRIYAATSTGNKGVGGVSISQDGGSTWSTTDLGSSGFAGSEDAWSVFASGDNVYVGTDAGLSISRDGGQTWTIGTSLVGSRYDIRDVYGEGDAVYAATESGIAISENIGQSWRRAWSGNFVFTVHALDGEIFAGSNRSKAYARTLTLKLEDDADNTASNQIQGATTHELTINNLTRGENNSEYFVKVSLENCEQTSDDVNLRVVDKPEIIDQTPTNGSVDIAIDTDLSIKFSHDVFKGSGNLKIFNYATDAEVHSFSADDLVINGKIVSISSGISLEPSTQYYVTLDEGLVQDHLARVNLAVTDKNAWSFSTVCEVLITAQPLDQTGAIGGSATFSVPQVSGASYTWYGKNESWERLRIITDRYGLFVTATDILAENGVLYASTQEGLFISENMGDDWTQVDFQTTGFAYTNRVRDVYASGDDVYAATRAGLSVSGDRGVSWSTILAGNGLDYTEDQGLYSVFVLDGKIYAGTDKGLFVSSDNGASWTSGSSSTTGFQANNSVTDIYVSGNTINAITTKSIWVSNDGGLSWNTTNSGENGFQLEDSDLITDLYAEGNTLYITTSYSGGPLFSSVDGGENWTTVDLGFPDLSSLQSVLVNNDVIYAAKFDIYTSEDAALTWTEVSEPGLYIGSAVMGISADDERVYAITGDGDVFIKGLIGALSDESDNTAANRIQGASTHELTISNLTEDFDQTEYFVEVTKATCQESSDLVTLTVTDGIIDVTPPVDPVITGISDDTGVSDSDGITTDQNILVYGTAEPNATIEVSTQFGPLRNTTTDANGDWVLDIQDITLVQIVTNFSAVAIDQAGNRSNNSNTFTLTPDFAAPAEPVITGISDDTGVSDSDGITTDQNILIYGTAEPNATIEVSTQFGPLRNTTTDANGDWVLDIQDITLVQIVTNFTAEAVDQAGNRSGISNTFVLTPDFTVPAKPVITGISDDTGISDSDGITTDRNILVYGTAEANATVEISTQFGPLRNTTADANGDWVLDIQDITLVQIVTHFTAEAVDEAGNRSDMSDTFTLTPDFTAPAKPVITGISDDTGSSNSDGITRDKNILIMGTAEANATVELSTQFGPLRNTTADTNGDWVLDITDITLIELVVSLTAEAVDEAGNRSVTSDAFVLTPDFTAPGVTISVGSSSPAGYTIDALFDEEVTGLTLGGINVTGGTAGSLVQNTTSSYSFFVSLSGSTVDIQVSAGATQDVAGNDNTVSNQLTLGLPPVAGGEGFTSLSEKPKTEEVRLYPNPVRNILTIDLSELTAEAVDVSLYDAAGTPVFNRQGYSQSELKLDVSSYKSGMYIVRLYDGQQVINKKVMVKK